MHQTIFHSKARPSSIRFTPVLNLHSGETVNLLTETMKGFEERVSFGPAGAQSTVNSPAAYIADHLVKIGKLAHAESDVRPVIVPISMAALVHMDTPLACDAAIRRTMLCHQEICFEVTDATLAVPSPDARRGLNALRKLGFRLSLDATRSWQAPLSADLRILFETMRIDLLHLDGEADLNHRLKAANACGMQVIAENANWRDGDWLSFIGVDLAVRPRADC